MIISNTNNILIYIIIVLSSFIYEKYKVKCNNETYITILISLLHHSFSMYIYFCTILFPYYKFNTIIITLTIVGWLFNKRCILKIGKRRYILKGLNLLIGDFIFHHLRCKTKKKPPTFEIFCIILKANKISIWHF